MDPRESLLNQPRIEDFRAYIRAEEHLVLEELANAPKAFLAALAKQASGKHIVFISGGHHESRFIDDLGYFFEGKVLEFPAWETLPSEDIAPSQDIVGERFRILHEIQETKESLLIVTSLQAALQKVLGERSLTNLHLPLKKGMSIAFDSLPSKLSEMGYHRREVAGDKGEFAVRGGIIDVFPVASPDPYRIECFDDEIVSLRKYDPISQVSFEKVNELLIGPGSELELLHTQKELSTLFDYLGPDTVVFFDDLAAIEDKYVALKSLSKAFTREFCTIEELFTIIEPLQKVYLTETPVDSLSEVQIIEKGPHPKIKFQAFQHELTGRRWRSPFLPLFASFCPPEHPLDEFGPDDFLRALLIDSLDVVFLVSNDSEEQGLKERIAGLGIQICASIDIQRGYLTDGFLIERPKLALVPMTELTHRYRIRRQKQRTHHHSLPVEVLALNAGEAVVHMNSGIGRFLGIEKRPNHLGLETEFFLVEYAEGAKLYVPMDQANLISKYIGATEEAPKLHTLGSNRWKQARQKTEAAIEHYAKQLLAVQAERAIKGGFVYQPDSDLTRQFAEEFPYVETPDQQSAIDKIYEDMTSTRALDRLVCGDVGFGKTEVAMRAAFKAVVDGGKQVAVLVPTTVLAMQHHETFKDRMSNFPVRIGLLSRFQTAKEIRETLEKVASGEIDILVGTHRIISKDVLFKNLGLMIIDEEQRFGVKAKEHLKALKSEVDCLTLTATPIPRTLYMSLVGARELSVINTPPEDRLPIQSFICQASEDVIKNALMRELARDGQAYLIHNRVESIFERASYIQSLVPQARIVVGHGQMGADELDNVFHKFKTGQADILVATSIIENGIDIANANTILVDRADRFGMADLYQIRGRVGRWNKKAYCYFLVPSTVELSEVSRKRLSALASSTSQGGGMKIALHDLEIRGAGNILGVEQSGHVSQIGFHLYCKLLKRAIHALQKGEAPLSTGDVKVEFPYDARLPEHYVTEVSLRMEMYQRLGDADSDEEIESLFAELRDRFGPPPAEVQWLHCFTRIRLFAAKHSFVLIKMTRTVMLAEQMHDKNKLSHRIIMPQAKTPEELEQTVIAALKKHFPLKTA